MNRPEEALQRAIVQGLNLALPHGFIVAHAANGGKRSKSEAGRFKAMGVVAGFPDLVIVGVGQSGAAASWFMELKAGRGTPTPAQSEIHDRLADMGHPVAVVRSWDEALAACRRWQLPLRISQVAA